MAQVNTSYNASALVFNGGTTGYGGMVFRQINLSGSPVDSVTIDGSITPVANTLYLTGGNVGIGTTTPASKLDVQGTPQGPGYEIGVGRIGAGGTNLIFGVDASATPYSWVQSVTNGVASRNLVLEPNAGYVGIGTTSPGYPLQVNGIVSAQDTTATDGYIAIGPGDASHAGYINFYKSGPARIAYLGYFDSAGSQNNLGLNLENSANFIVSGGNVGIGTASPAQKLDVAGNANVQGNLAVAGTLSASNFSGSGTTSFQSINTTGSVGIGTASPNASLDIWNPYSAGTDSLRFSYNDGAAYWMGIQPYVVGGGNVGYKFRTNNGSTTVDALAITGTGNVGIGTTTPPAGLSVISTNGGANGNWFDPANYAGYIHSNSNSAQHYGLLISDYWRSPENFVFAVDGRLWNGGTIANDIHNPYLVIQGSGNVGIGTANPGYKLDVIGQIHANEVIVDTSGADYVFAPNYKLMPLSQVEQAIKIDQHLPGIPSAQQMSSGGVSVGDLQTKLLAKVEELTLHMIAQQKELDALKAENAAMQVRLNTIAK